MSDATDPTDLTDLTGDPAGPGAIEPDGKDWTWVLERPCPECGYAAEAVARDSLAGRLRADSGWWVAALAAPGAVTRADPAAWSVLEYACHVRDVHRVFAGRVRAMLAGDDPLFADWDQDATALAEQYDRQDPAVVGPELVAAADDVAGVYAAVAPGAWDRPGRRSNGSAFTVESLGRYHLHDVVHHRHDVERWATRATVGAYDVWAEQYAEGAASSAAALGPLRSAYATGLRRGSRVLEIGSGPGHDAADLEARGLRVRRTDVTPAFVDLLRAAGHDADTLDPLVDDLADPAAPGLAYDGVWANACLLHVARTDLAAVLARLAAVTRPGGVLFVSFKEGDGEGWSVHGAVGAARRFVYWRETALREVLAAAGWVEVVVTTGDGSRGERWLQVRGVRAGAGERRG